MIDVVLLTDDRYENPRKTNDYINNILLEAALLKNELEKIGLKVTRKSWSSSDYDWEKANSAIFRTTWDYFDRFAEFKHWVNEVKSQLLLINPLEIIEWNMDKHYLKELSESGINIPTTHYAERGSAITLKEFYDQINEEQVILKPVVSGAARHTYKLNKSNLKEHDIVFQNLVKNEGMMIQPFMKNIQSFGEISVMLFGGKYSHAIIKKTKPGDFRVQDDFGGTVELYKPSNSEIEFAERIFENCKCSPVYGRADITYDNDQELCLMELELIEPELWFRFNSKAAEKMAIAVKQYLEKSANQI